MTNLSGDSAAAVHGILLLDKPLGVTSAGAVNRIKVLFGTRKAGHMGALDPLATGVLVVCLGEATKFAHDLLEANKTYRVEIQLGQRTASADLETEVVEEKPVPGCSRADVERIVADFPRLFEQLPPMHSALKQGGKPLYEYARAGVERERARRSVVLTRLRVLDWRTPRLTLEVEASKGTYIRTLAEDIALALGTVGHVASLRRIAVGEFDQHNAVGLGALAAMMGERRLQSLLPVDAALRSYPCLQLDGRQVSALSMGRVASLAPAQEIPMARLYGPEKRFIGLGRLAAGGELTAHRLVAAGRF